MHKSLKVAGEIAQKTGAKVTMKTKIGKFKIKPNKGASMKGR